MGDPDDVGDLDLRLRLGTLDKRGLDRPFEEHGQLEPVPLGTDEEVARRPGEHDATSRRVDPLLTELDDGFAQPLVGVLQVFGEIFRERVFGGGPAVVRFAFRDPLLAVVTLVRFHAGGIMT
jgi:hypothetical protein